jgi:peptidoglycan/LPS O-acetylase OafA/YrhL
MVFADHAFHMSMGWVGVDLFFVLSGFLITRILRQERNEPKYWSRFYTKRAARILPPLIIFFIACALLFRLAFPMLWFAYIFFAADLVAPFVNNGGDPVGVIWSLAIEEHFYIFWPFAVQFLEARQLIRLLTALLVLGPLARAMITPFTHSSWVVYYMTPFRLDGIATGSLLALLWESERVKARIRPWAAPAFFVAITCLCGGMVLFPSFKRLANSAVFNSLGYSLVVLAAASFIGYTLLHENATVTKLLSLPPLTFLGRISYGVYLFHVIFIAKLSRYGHHAAYMCLAFAGVTLFN